MLKIVLECFTVNQRITKEITMRNEYSTDIGLATLAAHNEEGRKKGKPSREYRKAREQKRNHAQSGVLALNLWAFKRLTLLILSISILCISHLLQIQH